MSFHSSFVIPIFVILLFPFLTPGQIPFNVKQKKIDSLITRLKTSQDTAYVNTLNNLSLNLSDKNFDSAYRYAQRAIAWARHYKYKKGEGLAYYNTGNCYFVKMDLKTSLDQYFKALRILEPLGPSMDLENLYFQMGYINSLVPNNDRTIEYFHKALNVSMAIHDSTSGALGACFELSLYYWQKSWNADQPESNRFLDSAYKYSLWEFEVLHDDTSRNLDTWVDCLITKGVFQKHRSRQKAYESLIRGLNFALKLKETKAGSSLWLEIDDPTAYDWYIGLSYGNLADYYLYPLEDFNHAEKYYLLSLVYYRNTSHIEYISGSFTCLGWIAKERKQYTKAIRYFKKSEALCDTFLNDQNRRKHIPSWTRLRYILQIKNRQVDNYTTLSEIYQNMGDLGKALEYQKKAERQRRNITMAESEYQINLLQTNFENEQTTIRIASLAGENELQRMKLLRTRILLFGFGAFALVLILAVIFYFQRNKLRIRQKALVLEQKLLRSQMNPHFIFNSLSSIQNFIVTERPDKASLYLSKFARLVRNILDNSMEEYVILEKEINTLENYLELQKIRFAGKFDYRIHIADEIDIDSIKIPPMLAQPFIENAIEHGIKHRETPGHIDIRFSLKDHILIFEVEDDGIGRQKAREIAILKDPEHRSMATSLTRERLANLNRKLNEKIRLEIIDLKNALGEATGTRVMFGIPVGK